MLTRTKLLITQKGLQGNTLRIKNLRVELMASILNLSTTRLLIDNTLKVLRTQT